MKLVKAIIRPEKLHDVLQALYEADVQGLTIHHVKGHGGEPEVTETYRGAKSKRDLREKVLLEIGLSDSYVEPTIEAIMKSGRTGEVGDGKIFVQPIEHVYRIRTGEKDEQAVTPVE